MDNPRSGHPVDEFGKLGFRVPTHNGESRDIFLNTPAYEAPAAANVPCEGHDTPVSDLFDLVENGWMETYGFRTDFPFADAYRTTLPVLR